MLGRQIEESVVLAEVVLQHVLGGLIHQTVIALSSKLGASLNLIGRLESLATRERRGISLLAQALDAADLVEEVEHPEVLVGLVIKHIKAVGELLI